MTTPISLDSLQAPQCVPQTEEQSCRAPAAQPAPPVAAAIDRFIAPFLLAPLAMGITASWPGYFRPLPPKKGFSEQFERTVLDDAIEKSRNPQAAMKRLEADGGLGAEKFLAKAYTDRGFDAMRRGHYWDAPDWFERAAVKYSTIANIHIRSGDILSAAKAFDEAAKSVTRKGRAMEKSLNLRSENLSPAERRALQAEITKMNSNASALRNRVYQITSRAQDAANTKRPEAWDELARTLKTDKRGLMEALRDPDSALYRSLRATIGQQLTLNLAEKSLTEARRDGERKERREEALHRK